MRYADSKAYMPQKALIEGKAYKGLSDYIIDSALKNGYAVLVKEATTKKIVVPKNKESTEFNKKVETK